MTALDAETDTAGMNGSHGADSKRRKVVLLLPVWGARYIQRFSEIGLKTLLAPGNVPALAEAFDCEFIFLTRAEDVDFFDQLAPVRKLREFCDVSFRDIEPLIVDTTYAVTITMAFADAVRDRGAAMLETYFVFLVADYIMADGSLRSLIPHIRAGRGAIQAGNFQVVEEDFLPLLADFEETDSHSIRIPPRTLVRMALEHLHPITFANFAENDVSHADHCNRLFWRVEDGTMVGRFFLLHMLCIRPETADFEIGSSCDYSFVPEMCPSGNWLTFTDSDDYLVVEHQPRLHEAAYIKPGRMRPADLVRLTESWTTACHRRNIASAIVYHERDLAASEAERIRRETDRYVADLMRRVRAKPKPVRGHPYWLGAVEGFRQGQERKGVDSSEGWLVNESWYRVREKFGIGFMRDTFRLLFGTPPFVYPWHHNWIEHRGVMKVLKKRLSDPATRMMVVSESVNPFSRWLLGHRGRTKGFQTTRLLAAPRGEAADGERFNTCFVFMISEEIPRVGRILDRLGGHLDDGAEILVVVYNDNASYLFNEFLSSIIMNAPKLLRPGIDVKNTIFTFSISRLLTEGALNKAAHIVQEYRLWGLPALLLILLPTYAIVLFDNLTRAAGLRTTIGYCTSVFLRLAKTGRARETAAGPRDSTNLRSSDVEIHT